MKFIRGTSGLGAILRRNGLPVSPSVIACHRGTFVATLTIEQVTDPNLNIIVYRSLTESSSEPTVSTKPGMWFEFPLYPGKTWVSDYDWEMKGAAPAKGKGEDRGRAIGWEDIQVPAGTFHALKVEVKTRFFGSGGVADEATLGFLYSPKVNRFVKFDYRSFYEGELVAELVRYQPASG